MRKAGLLRRTTAIILICTAPLAGVALGRAGLPSSAITLGAASAIALLALGRRNRLATAALMLTALAFGLWRSQGWVAQQNQLKGLIGQTVTITGTIADDPSHSPSGQLDFNLGQMTMNGRPLPGGIGVHEYDTQLQRGYRVELTGKVKAGFGNTAAEMSFPKLTVLSRHQDWLERLRQRFFVGIKTALPEPIASFGLGLLVGIRALIPKDMQTELTLVGLSHLVAVSGYNLTIIIQAVDRALKRFGRGIALVVSLWLIVAFLILTGASASIVRASVVSVLSLLAAFYGRRFQPMVLIMLAAAATAAYNPKYLTDFGWLLSFLAFFGILVLAPAAEARLGHPKPILIRLFIESFSAQIVTLPLILCFFSQLSIVAPITNLIILPMIPLAMAASFVAGLAGMLLPPFAGWFAWPAMLLLGFITKLIGHFAALPWAGRDEHLSFTAMMVMYAVILILTIALVRAAKHHPAPSGRKSALEPVGEAVIR